MESKPSIGNSTRSLQNDKGSELTHDETLAWIKQHRAWRRARKTKPMWSRAVVADEVGKEFQTADGAVEKAVQGAWLCVGVANEPWFQHLDKIEAKYEQGTVETKQFTFDGGTREYILFHPKPDVVNWAACIDGADIAGFSIRPGYDTSASLHSIRGGYVVTTDTPDPYSDKLSNVWLVQRPLFESTYELMEE